MDAFQKVFRVMLYVSPFVMVISASSPPYIVQNSTNGELSIPRIQRSENTPGLLYGFTSNWIIYPKITWMQSSALAMVPIILFCQSLAKRER
jgi:hypothetical protein